MLLILLKAILFPLIQLHNAFLKYRDAKLYSLTITTQVCYLERMLNDRYDFTLRRIRIADAVWHLPWFLYQEAELKPEYLWQEAEGTAVVLYTEGESGAAKDDFVVLVPSILPFDPNEMRSAIDNYRLFGTQYKIQVV
jgi:hypothetical protein